MTNDRREAYLYICEGQAGVITHILEHINRMDACDKMLSWMVKNKIRSQRLGQMFQDCECSVLKLMSIIKMKATMDSKLVPIIGGENYNTGD